MFRAPILKDDSLRGSGSDFRALRMVHWKAVVQSTKDCSLGGSVRALRSSKDGSLRGSGSEH